MLSNVRGDSGFGTGLQQAQVQTPRPDIKMPPVGNFAPPSATKENKKRRGGPGSQMTGGAASIDTGAGPSGLSNRNGGARGNANKVSDYLLLLRWKINPLHLCLQHRQRSMFYNRLCNLKLPLSTAFAPSPSTSIYLFIIILHPPSDDFNLTPF